MFKNIGKNDSINGIIAGPYTDNKSKQYLVETLPLIPNIEYVGSVSDDAKSNFFNNIDILIIPSKNEAEPLIILEALSYGVPIIANSIGCIPQMLNTKCGFLIHSTDDFINASYRIINKLKNSKSEIEILSINSFQHFNSKKTDANSSLNKLIAKLTS